MADSPPAGAGDTPVRTARDLLRRALWRHRRAMSATLLLFAMHQISEALVPVVMGQIIDRAVATGDVGALLLWLGALVLVFTVLALSYRTGARIGNAAFQRETHLLRVEVTARSLDPRGMRPTRQAGELLSIGTSDAERSALVLRAGALVVAAVSGFAVASVALVRIDVRLGLLVLLGVPVMTVALQVLAPWLAARTERSQAALGSTSALATDLVRGLAALRGLGAQPTAARRYRVVSQQALGQGYRTASANGVYEAVTIGVTGLLLAAVTGVAGTLAAAGTITVGELITVVGLAAYVADPVRTIGFGLQLLAQSVGSARRVAAVLSAPTVVTPGTAILRDVDPDADARDSGNREATLTTHAAALDLHDVRHASLRGVDLRVRRGELVGVVVHDPADADALVALLSGSVPAEHVSGRVLVQGADLVILDLDTLRQAVLVAPHDAWLFDGTIRDNVAAARGAVPADALATVAGATAVHDVLDAHPDGWDRQLTDRGGTLSGGQRQRLALARALLDQPPVLVLRDPSSAVDAVTEAAVAAGLADYRRTNGGGDGHREGTGEPDRRGTSGSTVVITSSPALLEQADRVVVLARGVVRAEGTHAELLAADADYAAAVLR